MFRVATARPAVVVVGIVGALLAGGTGAASAWTGATRVSYFAAAAPTQAKAAQLTIETSNTRSVTINATSADQTKTLYVLTRSHHYQLGAPTGGTAGMSSAFPMVTALDTASQPVGGQAVRWWDVTKHTTGVVPISGHYMGAAVDGFYYVVGSTIYHRTVIGPDQGVKRVPTTIPSYYLNKGPSVVANAKEAVFSAAHGQVELYTFKNNMAVRLDSKVHYWLDCDQIIGTRILCNGFANGGDSGPSSLIVVLSTVGAKPWVARHPAIGVLTTAGVFCWRTLTQYYHPSAKRSEFVLLKHDGTETNSGLKPSSWVGAFGRLLYLSPSGTKVLETSKSGKSHGKTLFGGMT